MRISYSYGKDASESAILSHCIARRLENTPTDVTNYNDYDIVTLAGGINDCNDIALGCGLQLGTYEEALTDFKTGTITDTDFYHAMFKSCYWLRKLYTGKRIGIITPPATSFGDVFYSIETAMVKVANRFGIPVYISSQQDGISCDMEDFNPTYTSDGLHPNEVFNEIRARKIAAWIKTL